MKMRAPEAVRKLLTDHWEWNNEERHEEQWSKGVSAPVLRSESTVPQRLIMALTHIILDA